MGGRERKLWFDAGSWSHNNRTVVFGETDAQQTDKTISHTKGILKNPTDSTKNKQTKQTLQAPKTKNPTKKKNKPIKKSLLEPWSSITCKNPTIWLGWFKEWPTTVQEAELSFPLLSFAETYLKKQWLYFLCQSLCTESVSLPDRHCVLLWFNLSQPRPMQLLSCSPSSRTRVRIGKGKSWKTPGLRWI